MKFYENATRFQKDNRTTLADDLAPREGAPSPSTASEQKIPSAVTISPEATSPSTPAENATYTAEKKEKPSTSSPDTAASSRSAADVGAAAPDAKDAAKHGDKDSHPRTSRSAADSQQQQDTARPLSLNDSFTDLVQIIMRQAEQEFSSLQDTAQRNAATLASTALEKTMGIVSRTAANLYLDARQAVRTEAAAPAASRTAAPPPPSPPSSSSLPASTAATSSHPLPSLAKPHSFRSSIYYRCDFCDSVIETVRHSCTICPGKSHKSKTVPECV